MIARPCASPALDVIICSSVQIRDKRVRRPPDVLNRPLKSCGFLRRRGGAWPRLSRMSRIVTTVAISTSAVAYRRLGTGRPSFTGFKATAGGAGSKMLANSTCGQTSDHPSLGCA